MMRHPALLTLCAVGLIAVATGCAPAHPQMTASELGTMMQLRSEQLASTAESLGLPPQDDVPLVRWVTAEEASATWVECLNDAGFQATFESPDKIDFSLVPDEQNQRGGPGSQALWECQAMYTQDPRSAVELTDAQKGLIYDYLVNSLVPCLEAHGYTPAEPPSRSTYVTTFSDEAQWMPYSVVPLDEMNTELFTECPQAAPSVDIYGRPLPQPAN